MNIDDVEIEAKFFLHSLESLEQRLQEQGAQLSAARVLETNLRFDLPDGSLTADRRVLRLRQDAHAVLTYKGPAQSGAEVAVRQEIETQVSDFQAARRILEALGYRVVVMYEKYRTTYVWRGLEVVLDELPYGSFCEIEAPNAEAIHAVMNDLDLDWNARIATSYLGMFDTYKQKTHFSTPDLSFAAFEGRTVRAQDLGIRYAD